MAARRPKLTDQLRREIRASGLSVYRIAKDCEIAESQLHNFLNENCGLGLSKLDRLADYLGLELRRGKHRRRGQGTT